MRFVVKNTTKSGPLDWLCPHSCRGCGHLGAVLCECCKNDILRQQKPFCPLCKQNIAELGDCCTDCELPFEKLFMGGWREGALAKVIADYKYQAVRAAGKGLVEILNQAIPPNVADEIVVVPLPTIGRHVRERGFDHTLALAKLLARKRGWRCEQVLMRAEDTVQVGTKASERQTQAKRAYMARKKVNRETVYLLLDDVWTTGASMLAAAEVLKGAGAAHIWGAVFAVSK